MFLGGLLQAIPKVFYLLTMSILSIIDLFQLLMRKLAGLDCYFKDGTAQTGDIVYDFLTGIFTNSYPILSTVFWGLVILGFILLFLSTIIAIIRSEYTTEKADNGKGKIMFKAFKSVVFFALVPIVTLVGVYLANLVLVAVDKATTPNTNNYSELDTSKLEAVPVQSMSIAGKTNETTTYVTYSLFGLKNPENDLPYGTTTTTFSGTIFKAAAFNANRVRATANVTDENQNFANLLKTNQVTTFDNLFFVEDGDTAKLANKIDVAFADNVVFKKSMGDKRILDFDTSQYIKDNNNLMADPFPNQTGVIQISADKFNVQLVWYYYDLWQFNFIIGIGAAVICATLFINIIFGLMRRIIEMIGLFLIAPPLIGLMPLDNEKAYGGWRGNFIKKALMAYGAIGGMNIIFLILPELQKIKFFNNGILDWIVDTLIVLVALLAIKDFISLISGLVGGDDANKVGEGVGKDVGDLAGKALKIGATTVGVGAGVALAGAKVAKKGFDVAKWGSHAIRGNSVNKKASAMSRAEHHNEDLSAAREDALKTYGKDSKNRSDADLALQREYGYKQIGDLMKNDSAKYQELLDAQLAKDFDAKASVKGSKENTDLDTGFNARQAARNVTNKSVAATQTKFGQRVADNKKYKDDLKDLKARKRAGVGGVTRADIRLAKKQGWADDFSYIGSQIKDVGSPVVTSGKNFLGEASSILKSNSFYGGFMGKDGDTLSDVAYRMAGTNKKAIDKAKEKSKEQKAQIAQLEAQQKMILNALRQLEAEKHKR